MNQDVFLRLSTPNGVIKVGHQIVVNGKPSSILCLLCMSGFKDREKFEKHLIKEHKEFLRSLLRRRRNHFII